MFFESYRIIGENYFSKKTKKDLLQKIQDLFWKGQVIMYSGSDYAVPNRSNTSPNLPGGTYMPDVTGNLFKGYEAAKNDLGAVNTYLARGYDIHGNPLKAYDMDERWIVAMDKVIRFQRQYIKSYFGK